MSYWRWIMSELLCYSWQFRPLWQCSHYIFYLTCSRIWFYNYLYALWRFFSSFNNCCWIIYILTWSSLLVAYKTELKRNSNYSYFLWNAVVMLWTNFSYCIFHFCSFSVNNWVIVSTLFSIYILSKWCFSYNYFLTFIF